MIEFSPSRVVPAFIRARAGIPGPTWANRLVADFDRVLSAMLSDSLPAPAKSRAERFAIVICGTTRKNWDKQASKWQREYMDRGRLADIVMNGIQMNGLKK